MPEFSRRAALAAALAATTGALALSESADAQHVVTTPSGLKYIDLKVGTGASPRTGQTCVMHYTGWLYEGGKKGAKFDSSVDRGEPFEFPIGMGQVIAGWDEGVATMSRRQAHADHPAGARLRRARRRRRHPAERDAAIRRRAARHQIIVRGVSSRFGAGSIRAGPLPSSPPGLSRRSMLRGGATITIRCSARPRTQAESTHGLPGQARQ
jgi:hypothetical protein